MSFDSLNLHPLILKAVTAAGYTEPTKIQLEAIPLILEGGDLRASAQTGTGKTAAFLLPALNRLTVPSTKAGKGARVLILVPTRELAMQIAGQAEKYSKFLNRVQTVCVVGGVPYFKQTQKLSRPHDVLIATPGRLIDFINQRKIDFSRLEMLVLDEADRMLDMGFVEPVEEIVAHAPSSRQTLMFSATLEGSVIKLSNRLLKDPKEIILQTKHKEQLNIVQKLHYTDDLNHKNRLLDHILGTDEVRHTIVFTATKRHADQLVGELLDKGHQAAALHGDMRQRQRTKTIEELRKGKINVLVATDVAARGIDVQSITHVINFDLPRVVEDYVHRIGRTGRAGANGTALSFVARNDTMLVKRIEQFTGYQIDIAEIAGLEPRARSRAPQRPFSRPSSRTTKGRPNSFRDGAGDSRPPSRTTKGRPNSFRDGAGAGAGQQRFKPKPKSSFPNGPKRHTSNARSKKY